MTPAAIITLVKDFIILVAVGLLIYLLISYGKDIVKVSDLKEFQKQLTRNAATEEQWRKDQTDAIDANNRTLAKVNTAIDSQRAPVLLCRKPPAPQQLPAHTGPASSGPASIGGTDERPGDDRVTVLDIRPQLNFLEHKYEKALSQCRSLLDSWPKNPQQ
jgi:hypothetical protein